VKRKRFSVEQIVALLKQAEVGVLVAELIRQVGSRSRHCIAGRSSTRELKTDPVRQFKQFQKEDGGLKRLVVELMLDKVMLQDVPATNCDALAARPGGGLFARDLSGELAACMPCGAASGLDFPL
jgi:putative transposase